MYREAQYWTRTGRRDEINPGSAIPEEDDGRRRYSKEDWAAILLKLGMGPGGSGTIPGNSQLGLLVLPIP